MNEEVKVFILADTMEDYKLAVEDLVRQQEDFIEKHNPVYYTGSCQLSGVGTQHKCFYDYRKASRSLQAAGYEIDIM